MFEVHVADNFHYMDESEVYTHGSFSTWADAVMASQKIVDSFLAQNVKAGMTADKLYRYYTSFGDDPFITPAPDGKSFSAWDYAKQRCQQLCGSAIEHFDHAGAPLQDAPPNSSAGREEQRGKVMLNEADSDKSTDHEQILRNYLATSLPLVSQQFQAPCVRVAAQVFILGMADMLRQAGEIDWDRFIDIYENTLRYYSLLPEGGTKTFVREVGELAARSQEVGQLMRRGAQSITMYVSEHDANAPDDLLGVPLYAKKHASAFTALARVEHGNVAYAAPAPQAPSSEFTRKRRNRFFDVLPGWRRAKSERTSAPIRLSGGEGSSVDDAVIVHSADRASGVAAEYQRLEETFGRRGVDWELEMQMLKEVSGRDYDVFKLKLSNGTYKTYVFDIGDYR